MRIDLQVSPNLREDIDLAIILNEGIQTARAFCQSEDMFDYVNAALQKEDCHWVKVTDFKRNLFFVLPSFEPKQFVSKEKIRKVASEIVPILKKEQITDLQVVGEQAAEYLLAFSEGLVLTYYEFLEHKTKKETAQKLQKIALYSSTIKSQDVAELNVLCEAVYIARDLTNRPFSHQSATQFSQSIKKIGKEAGFDVEVFDKEAIKSHKMGGLLGVNQGSIAPPTFSIMEYLPPNAINSQPYVLVGKGVVFDTGGVNIKYLQSYMRDMKCDMAGAAVVIALLYAIAKNKLPIHVIGLVPATDNQVSSTSMVPGDVLTMHSGTTVEIANTDAEGRLVLADALSYAKQYQPKLVIDLATLTGSAVSSIGSQGIVYMGKVPVKIKNDIENSGREMYERVVEFPLWEEYGEMLKSDVADLSNLGGDGGEAGAITAAKFLEYFTDYDWLHFDIAGPAFFAKANAYRPKNGTGFGVRLLYHFFKSQIKQ